MAGDNELAALKLTAASILGIKGPLRFKPHGATQKAHVVLRRVDPPEDSEDEGDGKPMVYFSLFAQKRIEVKPGKEILLAVATPDGRTIDTPVMLAGEVLGKDSKTEEEPSKSVSTKPPTPPTTPISLPPRLRKTWNKANDASPTRAYKVALMRNLSLTSLHHPSASISHPPRTHESVGVQCDLTYSSHSVQTHTEPEVDRTSCSVQTEVSEKPTPVVDISLAAQPPMEVDEPPKVADEDRSGSPVPESPVSEPYSPTLSVNLGMNFSGRDRSLSPMELDSPGSSPTVASAALPAQSEEDRPKSMSLSPPTHSVSTSPTSVPSKFDLNVDSLHLSPHSAEPSDLAGYTAESGATGPRPPQPITPASLLAASGHTVSPARDVGAPHTQPSNQGAFVPQVVVAPNQPDTASYKAKRKPVHNPFVSGGLLTDFVSGSAAKPGAESSSKEVSFPLSWSIPGR